jgi:hypothetical protein
MKENTNCVSLSRRNFLFGNIVAAGLATLSITLWEADTEFRPQELANEK